MKMKAETGVMLSPANECQKLPANPQKLGERPGPHFSSQPSEGGTDLRLPGPQTSSLQNCDDSQCISTV